MRPFRLSPALGRDDGAVVVALVRLEALRRVSGRGGGGRARREAEQRGGALLRLLAPQDELPPRRRGRRLGLDDGDTLCAGRLRHLGPSRTCSRRDNWRALFERGLFVASGALWLPQRVT